jgi:hypothetical protein
MKAFPSEFWVKNQTDKGETTLLKQESGMDLRDYFAAKAMQAFMEKFSRDNDLNKLADNCYRYADAMMKAREQ